MMVSKKVVASLLLVYVVSMLAEQTEGFVPFFTQSDFRKMQVTPRNVLQGLEPQINQERVVYLDSSLIPQALPVHTMPPSPPSPAPSVQTGGTVILAVPHSSRS